MFTTSEEWSDTHQSWSIGGAKLHIVHGDIFRVPAESLVNPENTRFDMAPPTSLSISGQLTERYGLDIQYELHLQTRNERQPQGTVLETSGFDNHERIYHVGHHHPGMWDINRLGEDLRAEHYRVLRAAMGETLRRFGYSDLTSIAFPLLGCGSVGLDPWLVTYEFMKVLMHQAADEKLSGQDIWLVVYHGEEYPAAINAITQALADAAGDRQRLPALSVGVSYLDKFEEEKLTARHTKWATWMILLYTEQLIRYMLFQLALASNPIVGPHTLLDEDKPLSFGYARASAYKLANLLGKDTASPVRPLAEAIVRDNNGQQRLVRMNQDRNNLAHGRSFRELPNITADLTAFLDASQLRILAESGALPAIHHLHPWLHQLTDTKVGVLEEWSARGYHYIEPVWGERLVVDGDKS